MPFCFRFPPTVAGTGSSMRPMPDSDLPALCDHCIIANRAFAREAPLSFPTFSFNGSEFHLLSPPTTARFDEKQQYWVRNVDQVPLIDESVRDRRFYITLWGWLLFILWEAYWLWEIRARFVETGRLQLPYVFLFFVLVVVPLAWYLFLRRKLRRLAMIPHDLR